ncbi:MAG: hypothetical protein IPI17_06300 [Nitrosomonas sp.]|jgi:hypothetical protein|nr:hypothetical protein [Nitrosomonas sp.]
MNIHKRTRLTLLDLQEIWRLYQTRLWKVVQLAEHFHVRRSTIYDVLKRARLQEFTPRREWAACPVRDMPFAPVGGANLEST